MGSRVVPELSCMEPEHYKKLFRCLCWSGTRRQDRKPGKKSGKKEKLRRLKTSNSLAVCYAPSLLGNPSQFVVYATIRQAILARWKYLYIGTEISDDSDNEEQSPAPLAKLPKVTGIGLKTLFALISRARQSHSLMCREALVALLDVLQGHAPEVLQQEPHEIIWSLHSMLVEVSGGSCEDTEASQLTALACSCLIALSVARGEAELILLAAASLIMSAPQLADQPIKIPTNLTVLQRSVQSFILGSPSRNLWLNFGVPMQSLVTSFPIDIPPTMNTGPELVVRSLVSDGCYLFVFTSKGLLKIGSGYGSSIKQHVYLYKPDFFASDRHGWLGYCKDKLYVRIGRKKTDIYEVDKYTFEIRNVIRLDPGTPAPVEPKAAVFTDGNQLGLILLTNFDSLTIRMYDVESAKPQVEGSATSNVTHRRELNVHLLRRRILSIGRAPFEDGLCRRPVELEAPVAMQLDDNEDDPLIGISAGQDFGLLTTASGKVYYTGKGTSLGYKAASPNTGRWTLMKETLFTRNDLPNIKKCKVIQVAVGHEGVHAVLVLDNGSALFAGIARRGEDGDAGKHRRTPKAFRPKKIIKADSHYIVSAACNHGSTALVTRQGQLLIYGKDTTHCDCTGLVPHLTKEKVVQVTLGKAHAVALTSLGQVYTFGINNKGQCGREFGYTKEKSYVRRQPSKDRICRNHTWISDFCRVCIICRECTGFSNACHCSLQPNRTPGEKCGCGEGDGGCTVCGVCKRCAEAAKIDEEKEAARDKEGRYWSDGQGDGERDPGLKMSCLPPARVSIPGGHKISAIAAGLHHTVLLTEHGEVLTFGSNQYGQLGAGDVATHHRIVRVRVPRATAVAAGSNHTAILTRDGELYTFGSFQKGALGRPRIADGARGDRSPVWYATPGRVPRLGLRHACKAVWISAAGDQTFVQVSQALIKTDTLFSSTITANSNSIVILPNRPEHTFKCITINSYDGTCNAFTGPEQVDFVNTLACLDPLYDVLWCYHPQMRVMKCYNILAFDSHTLQRCNNDPDFQNEVDIEYPSYGSMKRLEDFKDLQNFEVVCGGDEPSVENVALLNMSVLNQELAIPSALNCFVSRIHAALHLLGCLDSLTYAHDNRLNLVECKRDNPTSPVMPVKEDFLTVNRFESHGGGWGYSGHSIEAIRFMCDTDILIGGYGLFGGRGDYTAKIKLFDIGQEGGDQEGDGELVAESEEVVFECAPRDRFPVMFEAPVLIVANRWYIAWACVNGPSSDCGSSGQAMVINDEVGFHFKTSKKSNNGTDVNAGQIPSLIYNIAGQDMGHPIKCIDISEPIIVLSRNISKKVTVSCFRSLITILQWSWTTFKDTILDTNGQLPINFQKLQVMKHQKRLVYVIRACLRLVKSYINEVYPQNSRRRNSHEYLGYFDVMAEVRTFIQRMMAEPIPTCSMLPKKAGKNKAHRVCYVQFALEMTNSILKEANETITACFHAFFPTPNLKWNHICSLLVNVKDGVVPTCQARELEACCGAMCATNGLREVLQYIAPATYSYTNVNPLPIEHKKVKEVPSKSATVPRSSHAQKPPPVPPRTGVKIENKPECSTSHKEWHLLDVTPRLLDMVLTPTKRLMTTRQCGQAHDHGELAQQYRLAEYSAKLLASIVARLNHASAPTHDELESNTVKQQITPSRFMRVNNTRSWNTGNGSPDAICFTVDQAGVILTGVCVYSGLADYEYTLELLHDVRLRSANDEGNSHCWVSVEVAQGSFSAAHAHHDMVQLKFERPVPLKEELRYAIRLCNHGDRTVNGDCGLPSVKGPDGTTFTFASCSLSFNGTTLARGQIPCLIYYSTTQSLSNTSENAGNLITALRSLTLRVSSEIMTRCSELFASIRNELTAEELRRNASVLQQSPAVNILLPYTLAHLHTLEDSKSVIQVLEMVHEVLPHVAAMNLLIPGSDDMCSTTSHHYTVLESEHPYKQATVTNMRVLFPPSVSWTVVELDPRSITAQPEDALTVYAVAGSPRHRCHCDSDIRPTDPPFRKVYKKTIQLTMDAGEAEDMGDESDNDTPCMHYNCTYVSVTPKLANLASDWPQRALLVPGNEVIFSLETATDYLNEYNKPNNEDKRYGFRALCVGYEDAPFTAQKHGLQVLEMELVYAGSSCASRLLAPDLDIPPLSFSTIVEVQVAAMMGATPSASESEPGPDSSEALLLARGLELSTPLSVHQVLDAQPLLRSVSTERQFLSDFVAGAESTAGGRLARWLSPAPRVEPSKCELKPPASPARPSVRLDLPIDIRDQYGDIVTSPALKIDVIVQRVEDMGIRGRRPSSNQPRCNVPDVPYQPTTRDTMCFQSITMMKAYQNFSFEELRYSSSTWGEMSCVAAGAGLVDGGVPNERLTVSVSADGAYAAAWTPRAPGVYVLRCTLDDHHIYQELTIEVTESFEESTERGAVQGVSASPPAKVRRFMAPHSAGLRVRSGPSLQAEELGRVPPGASIHVVEELENKDGVWVRLGAASVHAYANGSGAAWCLQHHGHLDRTLLAVCPNTEVSGFWEESVEEDGDLQPWTIDDDFDINNDVTDLRFSDPGFDSDDSPFVFGAEPSKRSRLIRNEAAAAMSPRRTRRSNGNSDDWWSPSRRRSNDSGRDIAIIQEVEVEVLNQDGRVGYRLAQTGTQTSPHQLVEDAPAPPGFGNKDEKFSPKTVARERIACRTRASKRAVSPPQTRPTTPPPAPIKYALSPSQAECIRAIFAALLWHEGIVHDAIACAAFLKFHPQLPKQGARVVTRGPSSEPSAARPQRHSVEVTNAGQYLRINSSTLETLSRCGAEASLSRARRSELEQPITEENTPHTTDTASTPSVVNVLPPALRALVGLWDALYDADQLAPATDKNRVESDQFEESRQKSGITKKRDWKTCSNPKPYTLACELCGGVHVNAPLASHMRQQHAGCRAITARGYDRGGVYRRASPPPSASPTPLCGQLSQAAFQLWYMYCESCRDRTLKGASAAKQAKSKAIAEVNPEKVDPNLVDHQVIKENAVFLLDLAPLTNSESSPSPGSESIWSDSGRSPPTPPATWRPAPPFQCLQALGAEPKAALVAETARYHSLGRPLPISGPSSSETQSVWPHRVHRSVSMGQAAGRGLAAVTGPSAHCGSNEPPSAAMPGAGSSLLAQPSSALRKLVSNPDSAATWAVSAVDAPWIDPAHLMKRPVLNFVLTKRDLHSFRQKMDAAVRINTIRQYAFEALNWLLRSATLPTSVHDVMWTFCSTLDQYARVVSQPVASANNKENAASEPARPPLATPSASAICPGGRNARGSRAAFHAFLGSVSALAPSLPSASAVALQAVRCWALHYSTHDRAFLHRSQVFSVISKILSHSEDGIYDEGMLGALHESFHNYLTKDNFVWQCPDVTGWCDISVSSRQGMAGALTDGSTETFWESGDEDRNKAKWIQVVYPGGSPDDRPHLLCVHLDNTRDTVNKTLLVSFLYSSGSGELFHMQDMEVDPKAATWLCYTLPRVCSNGVRVRCELRGSEPGVRVRQVRVLSAPAPSGNSTATSPALVLHSLAEHDTLRVFRLLTSQVFGKLLDWDRCEGEGVEVEGGEAPADDTDLREHVVGILFAGHKLTSLQRQVMAHIVCAIGSEAARSREDWEVGMLVVDAAVERGDEELPVRVSSTPDNYCFEMMSLLLALSGSAVGRAHLAQRSELMADLLALLHTSSDRVQRQVISLLRRMIAEIPPQKMLAAINFINNSARRLSLLDHLVSYLGKAISLQVKVKGAGSMYPRSIMMGPSVAPAPPAVWFMRGETSKNHAHLIVKLLSDMAEDKMSAEWGLTTRTGLATYVANIGLVPESDRRPAQCIAAPAIWLALASLTVTHHDYLDLVKVGEGRSDKWRERDAVKLCRNHDDGSTQAGVECAQCGALCTDCDRFLHLPRANRTHHRQICKEEESAIRVDIHEGCGRAKLFWLLLLIDRRTLKALAEFRGMEGAPGEGGPEPQVAAGPPGMAGVCRFCGTRGNSGLLAIGNVCADQQCQEHGRASCSRTLSCGHACGGVRAEAGCLPCLFGCGGAVADYPLRQDADDMCMICFTDPLQAAPAIQLKCGHVFHLHCCKKVLMNKWNGPRITFSFSQCPICKEDINHWTLEEWLLPLRRLRDEVQRKAVMRLEFEGLAAGPLPRPGTPLPVLAMERYAYYVCHKCGKAYFGGLARCEAETSSCWEAEELVCGACSDVAGAKICPKHGADFLEYKCRFCCSVAVFFCFGTSHFCNACHDDFQRVTNIPKHLLPQCPAGPKGEQLPGTPEECPLHVQHPPTGEEFALGCGICRHVQTF